MRALILFDGSLIGYLCLKAAAQEAFDFNNSQAGKPASEQNEPTEALLISVALLVNNSNEVGAKSACYSHSRLNEVLAQGVKELERYGEFDAISAETICCALGKLTEVLVDRAREWKATSTYIALEEEKDNSKIKPLRKEVGWLRWLGTKTKPEVIEETYLPKPGLTLNTSQIRVKQFMEQSSSKIILVNSEGIAMKITYYASRTRRSISAPEKSEAGKFNQVA